jgi:hypothetical protein
MDVMAIPGLDIILHGRSSAPPIHFSFFVLRFSIIVIEIGNFWREYPQRINFELVFQSQDIPAVGRRKYVRYGRDGDSRARHHPPRSQPSTPYVLFFCPSSAVIKIGDFSRASRQIIELDVAFQPQDTLAIGKMRHLRHGCDVIPGIDIILHGCSSPLYTLSFLFFQNFTGEELRLRNLTVLIRPL